jgi:RNA recognition motif-containing protein
MPVAQNIADTSNVMVVPYSPAPIPTLFTHYRDPHYVDISTTQQYYQSMVCDTAAPVYTNGHQVTAPQFSHYPSNRPQANRAPSAPTGTPNRTVFLSRLPYTATGQVVRHLLEEFGTVEHCDVPLDRTSPNQIQGTAIVRFNESNDAARAIRNLNGTKWKGVIISARWDRESAGTSIPDRPPHAGRGSPGAGTNAEARREDGEARDQRRRVSDGPLIVNGSRGNVAPSRRRRGNRHDDSDSSEYDGDEDDNSSGDCTSP